MTTPAHDPHETDLSDSGASPETGSASGSAASGSPLGASTAAAGAGDPGGAGRSATQADMLSIGNLSAATGIPVATLRTWERRYGFPEPLRRDSGHRRYSPEIVQRLKMIKEALDRGHRPANTVAAPLEQLQEMLGVPRGRAYVGGMGSHGESGGWDELEEWMRCTRALDGDGFERALRRAWQRRGAVRFVHELASPYLAQVGDLWARDALQVRHEHFASERLRDFLTREWRPLADNAGGPLVLCATLSGEQHVLGLHLAAVLLALNDLRITFLGADTPVNDVVEAATASSSRAVVIASSPSAPDSFARDIRKLRHALPRGMSMVVGSEAPDPTLDGVIWKRDFLEFAEWARWFREMY